MNWYDKWPERATNAHALKHTLNYADKSEVWKYRFKQIHGNKYSYDYLIYRRAKEKVIITCPQHGEFSMLADNHEKGQGCPSCKDSNKYSRHTTEDFITKATEVHGSKYDYSLVDYKNAHSKVIIICPAHGEFLQSQVSHVRNLSGCPRCRSTASDTIYVLKCLDIPNVYKIGITGRNKLERRIRQISTSGNIQLECIHSKQVLHAKSLEASLLSKYSDSTFSGGDFDGSTEFRYLSDLEVLDIIGEIDESL